MTFLILTDDTEELIARSVVRPATNADTINLRQQEQKSISPTTYLYRNSRNDRPDLHEPVMPVPSLKHWPSGWCSPRSRSSHSSWLYSRARPPTPGLPYRSPTGPMQRAGRCSCRCCGGGGRSPPPPSPPPPPPLTPPTSSTHQPGFSGSCDVWPRYQHGFRTDEH